MRQKLEQQEYHDKVSLKVVLESSPSTTIGEQHNRQAQATQAKMAKERTTHQNDT